MSAKPAAEEWEPGTWDELFPGRFLKHTHLGTKEVELRIERIYNTLIDGELAQVAKFAPVQGITQSDWGLNKTNGLCLRALFGDEIKRDWPGKRVLVKSSVVEHGREKGKPCIRVCGSPDIPADLSVVIDFKTKRIKPFVIKVRSNAREHPKSEYSDRARELSKLCRGAGTASEIVALVAEIDSDMSNEFITKEEGSMLLLLAQKLGSALAEKNVSDVIR